MPGRQSSPEIVGRSEEMILLGQALDQAAEGRGGAVIVSGEAGVGKTRLLTEFAAARCAAQPSPWAPAWRSPTGLLPTGRSSTRSRPFAALRRSRPWPGSPQQAWRT